MCTQSGSLLWAVGLESSSKGGGWGLEAVDSMRKGIEATEQDTRSGLSLFGTNTTDRLSGRVRELCLRDDGFTPGASSSWSSLALGKFPHTEGIGLERSNSSPWPGPQT